MSAVTRIKRRTVTSIRAQKGSDPIVCLTAYTASFAQRLDEQADLLLVGDSVAMVHHGFDTTLPLTLEAAILHGQAVMRATQKACVIVDMPFGSYEESPQAAFQACVRVMKETGASGVKLEGGARMAETIAFLVERGIPVMAHIGLLPQQVHVKGGFKTTGREQAEWAALEADGRAVDEAGAFSVVIEGMAEPLAAKITAALSIPTIGIGASAACDGQILVTEDMLGLTARIPRFVERFAALGDALDKGVGAYAEAVRTRQFPGPSHTYEMKAGEDPRPAPVDEPKRGR